YLGDADFAPSNDTLTHTVNRAASTITASSAANPALVGQPFSVTAHVVALGSPSGNLKLSISGPGASNGYVLTLALGGAPSYNTVFPLTIIDEGSYQITLD